MPTVIEGITFYTIPEVAEILRVTTNTVRNWIAKGRMKSIRIGRPIYITDKEVKEFLSKAM